MSQQRTINGKENFLAALKKSMGIILHACEEIDISRETYYNWRRTDPEFKNAVENAMEDAADYAESLLVKRMQGMIIKKESVRDSVSIELPPDVGAIKFYLKYKGKKLGYGKQPDIDEPEKKPYVAPVFVLRPQGEKPDIIEYGKE